MRVSPAPFDFLIAAALPQEIGPLRRALEPPRKRLGRGGLAGHVAGQRVAVVLIGSGPRVAPARLEAWLGEVAPCEIWLVGLAAALVPSLGRGELRWPRVVCHHGRAHPLMPPEHRGSLSKAGGSVLVSVETLCTTARAKARLAREEAFQPELLDLETGPCAAVARDRGIPFATLRAVSDGASEDLPRALSGAQDRQGRISSARILSRALRDPLREIPGLLGMARRTKEHARRLATEVVESLRARHDSGAAW